MPNRYEWTEFIPEVDPDPDGEREQRDVVVSVLGRMSGSDGELVANADARAMLPPPNPDNFIEHKDLTVEWLQEICEAKNGDYLREMIARQLEAVRKLPRQKLLPCQVQEPSE